MNLIWRADIFSLGLSIAAFLLFLVVHVALLRRSDEFPADRAIAWAFVLGALSIGAILALAGGNFISLGLSKTSAAVSGFAALGMYPLLVFHYLVWVFGMGEAAIRIRLLRELEQAPGPTSSLDEIRVRYNANKIFESRLERLLKAGHLDFDGTTYGLKRQILRLQIGVEGMVKRLLGISCESFNHKEPV